MKSQFLRGVATINYWADDVVAARDWYSRLFGISAYFQNPDSNHPAYVEFRIGDHESEFGIVDRKFAHNKSQTGPGGIILYWHVDNLETTVQQLIDAGATLYEPVTKRGDSGFITASILDPFGNILGIMQNPHYVEQLRLSGSANNL